MCMIANVDNVKYLGNNKWWIIGQRYQLQDQQCQSGTRETIHELIVLPRLWMRFPDIVPNTYKEHGEFTYAPLLLHPRNSLERSDSQHRSFGSWRIETKVTKAQLWYGGPSHAVSTSLWRTDVWKKKPGAFTLRYKLRHTKIEHSAKGARDGSRRTITMAYDNPWSLR